MADRKPGGVEFGALRPFAVQAGVAAMVAAPLALLAWLLPPSVHLSAFAAVAILAALAIAGLAAFTGASRGGARVTYWDIAGGLAFIGFAAAMFGKPDHLVGFFTATALAP